MKSDTGRLYIEGLTMDADAKKALKEAGIEVKADECVKVVVRVRPLNVKERKEGRKKIVGVDTKNGVIQVKDPTAGPRAPPNTYTFDQTYDENTVQINLYNTSVAPLVENVIQGYNGTFFCYGQTGAGKSWTMEGDGGEHKGVMPNAFNHIFDFIAKVPPPDEGGTQFLVAASYLEIYNEEIRDLLGKNQNKRLEVHESPDVGVYVKDLTQQVCKNVGEIQQTQIRGSRNRSVGATAMNAVSSRSHSIFTIIVEASEQDSVTGEDKMRRGKLNLVDLAGSERQSKTGATGQRLKEATKINLSLSALGNVISALVDGKSKHIPYRDSKLTRLLRDSLGGNTKTIMCANCGPADDNYDETISTLRYANRAKQIKNKPIINEDPKDALLRTFQDEIEKLKEMLKKQGKGGLIGADGGVQAGGMLSGSEDESETESEEEVIIEEKIVVEKKERIVKKIKRLGVGEAAVAHQEELHQREMKKLEDEEKFKKAQLDKARLKKERKKNRLKEKLKRQEERAAQAAEAKREMERKLRDLQANLVSSDNVELDEVEAKERALAREKAEIEEQERAIAAAQARREENEQAFSMMQSTFSSLQEEAVERGKKLKKAYELYQKQRGEIRDMQVEFTRERETILDNIRELNQELKLKQFLVSRFIPQHYQNLLEKMANYNEEKDEWNIRYLDRTGYNKTNGASKKKLKSTAKSKKPVVRRNSV